MLKFPRSVRRLTSSITVMCLLSPALVVALGIVIGDLSAVDARAQDVLTGAFEGFVADADTKEPIAGAVVRIVNEGTGVPRAAITDSKGRFYLGLLIAGSYVITISKPGFQPRTIDSRLAPTRVNQVVPTPIFLSPEAAVPSPSAATSTSASTGNPPAAPSQPVAQERLLTQTAAVSALPAQGKRWALVIGIDKYRDGQISTLSGGVNDAHSLADALVRTAGFPADQVIQLATDQPEERQPTRINILRRLSNLAGIVPKDGLLLVSFSGHGIERGGQAFLIPSDAQLSDDVSFMEETAISVARMHDRIKATGVGQVLVLLDACRNDPGGRADAPNPLSAAYTRGFSFDVKNREVQAFATLYATAVGQRAYEYSEKKQGYFTWALVQGLMGAAANAQGEVTLSALVRYVQDRVPKQIAIDLGAGRQQRPFATIEGYRADDLIIAVSAPAPTVISVPAPRATSRNVTSENGTITVDIDPTTGLLAVSTCPIIRTRTYTVGKEPRQYCGPQYHRAASHPVSGERTRPVSP